MTNCCMEHSWIWPVNFSISMQTIWHRCTSIMYIHFNKIIFSLQELADLRSSGIKSFRDIQVDDTNILSWTGLITPVCILLLLLYSTCEHSCWRRPSIFFSDLKENPPFSKGAFRIEINFPAEYPFKPPKICFKTKIYHPNIDEKGQVCLPIISAENWKPATRTDQVIQALIALVNDPEPEHPMRADLAEEFLKDHKKFVKNAEEFTKKHSEKRPNEF